jgi:hypothetical protein
MAWPGRKDIESVIARFERAGDNAEQVSEWVVSMTYTDKGRVYIAGQRHGYDFPFLAQYAKFAQGKGL